MTTKRTQPEDDDDYLPLKGMVRLRSVNGSMVMEQFDGDKWVDVEDLVDWFEEGVE